MADAVEQAGPNCFVFRTSDDTFVQEEFVQSIGNDFCHIQWR